MEKELDELDASVIRALDYYRALIDTQRHAPSPLVREALIALSRAILTHATSVRFGGGDGTWH